MTSPKKPTKPSKPEKPANPYKVAIGQIWEDCDLRTLKEGKSPRTLTITRVYSDRGYSVANTSNNRTVEVRLDRFKPTATGYRLLPPAGDKS